ncbi:SRPBCC family protein [Nocardia cyriacigeorgica]|uniref:SRPBCC family protein n=1 Tax=Nocardia cyriacigeorgica TaxID=135487 RepID=UPI0013CF5355|nr:SRPBCC family protein [Nocardia cyriacigeorgica]MBF6437149.1 SRPBCC family protein [Nocardia cyriacigeorgica]MBF6452720.1 SRPBCC family protein [Nocardia cyriacigeorgica]MBF6476540.1 SRPBCC family protein [Nocardia cyriacigeorgica]MBF6549889.1 SRPBCC family protein [Nocardia cyriacigeorgica]NEW25559.1 SRPBCC family protein [Nocardia cyriacigeorgica]
MNTTTNDAVISTTSDTEIHVERVFNAPVDRVWDAYSRIEQLSRWWGRGNQLDVERWEFRKGGHWRFVEHADGESHGFEGRFREITPKESIVQSFEWDGMPAHVAIDATTFVDLGDGRTKVVTDSQFHTKAERDGMLQSGMESGLNDSYRALDALLAESA